MLVWMPNQQALKTLVTKTLEQTKPGKEAQHTTACYSLLPQTHCLPTLVMMSTRS